MENKVQIARTPIMLNDHDIIVIHLFSKSDCFDDLWMMDLWNHMLESGDRHEKAAVQFVAQLKDHWCVAFLEALIRECFKEAMSDQAAGNLNWQRKLLDELHSIMKGDIEADTEKEKWEKIIARYNEQFKFEKAIYPESNTDSHFSKWLQEHFKAPEFK